MRALLTAACCLLAATSPPVQAISVGETAPIIEAPAGDGSEFSLEALRGEVVYLDFWASWCPPCRAAMPALDALHERLGERGFSVVGINVDRSRDAALRMLKSVPVDFPIVFDPDGHWAARYALPGMPSGFLVDREGIVRYRHEGYSAGDVPALKQEIERLLEEEEQ
ncbi:TlpA family protein disulfide reductase [Algiphilus aromaticivorans]|uniref:TlpA family protein disulfide reductase n=1 Tax=Algiphilus aromaticivorans TaxID=382454 RepID=UPI0005C14125|nr:TlpA disulfide reductase family protein [Algiphilus aromaticivorans]